MKNNQKGFISIILVGVIVALVAIGGYFVFRKKSEPITQQSTSVVAKTNTPVTAPTPTDKTVNWKTYTSSQYDFEFKYPAGYQLHENDTFDVHDKITKLQVNVNTRSELEGTDFFLLYIKEESLNDTLARYKDNFINVTTQKMELNGNDFIVLKYRTNPGPESDGPEAADYETTYLQHGKYIYSFGYSPNFKNILSTFKFTK